MQQDRKEKMVYDEPNPTQAWLDKQLELESKQTQQVVIEEWLLLEIKYTILVIYNTWSSFITRIPTAQYDPSLQPILTILACQLLQRYVQILPKIDSLIDLGALLLDHWLCDFSLN